MMKKMTEKITVWEFLFPKPSLLMLLSQTQLSFYQSYSVLVINASKNGKRSNIITRIMTANVILSISPVYI